MLSRSIRPPYQHHGAFAIGVFIHVFIRKVHVPAVDSFDHDSVTRNHTPNEVAEILHVATLECAMVLFITITIFSRVPPELVFNRGVRIIDKAWTLQVIVGNSISHYWQGGLHLLVGQRLFGKDGRFIASIFHHMHLCCRSQYWYDKEHPDKNNKCGNNQSSDKIVHN